MTQKGKKERDFFLIATGKRWRKMHFKPISMIEEKKRWKTEGIA